MVEALNNDWVQEVMNKTRTTHKVRFKVNVQNIIVVIATQTTNSSSSIIVMYIRGLLMGGAKVYTYYE